MRNKLPDITTDFPLWYQELIYQAQLVDQSPVRGMMVIRPYGYALWENIKEILNAKIIATGHQNAAFPLLIPQSFLEKEARHVEGFAPELAVVTHAGGKKLEEPLVIRPTSETIIHYMFARWISSWRDLPLKINQWANIVRWELRTRPFLRTTEFFWQEGHTAHETREQALEEAALMLNEYRDLYQTYLAIPVITGEKSASERFAGADNTFTIEGFMPDGKALQLGTSHMISQSFAKSFGIQFQARDTSIQHPYLTSWGTTTRAIGALVMMHGDQKGLVLPPKIAPIQVVIIPIFKKGVNAQLILDKADEIARQLTPEIRVQIDRDEATSPGAKFYEWELKGVPFRIEIGPRDLESGTVMISDRLKIKSESVVSNDVRSYMKIRCEEFQQYMFDRAQQKIQNLWAQSAKLTVFGPLLETQRGFYQTGWCQSSTCEHKLKNFKATIRCLLEEKTFENCFACDQPNLSDVLVARAY